MKVRIGIDNGVSGSIGIITEKDTHFLQMSKFTKKEQDYTKKKKNITRLDSPGFYQLLYHYIGSDVKVLIERPMVNPKFFNTTLTAVRIMEAQMNVLELLNFGYAFVDSKQWQKQLLPQGIKGTPALKKASLELGVRTWPEFKQIIDKQKDADGLWIAEYCRLQYKL